MSRRSHNPRSGQGRHPEPQRNASPHALNVDDFAQLAAILRMAEVSAATPAARTDEPGRGFVSIRMLLSGVLALLGVLSFAMFSYISATVLDMSGRLIALEERSNAQAMTSAAQGLKLDRMAEMLAGPRFTQEDFQRQIQPVSERLERLAADVRALREEMAKGRAARAEQGG